MFQLKPMIFTKPPHRLSLEADAAHEALDRAGFFKAAMIAEMFLKKEWVISAFAITMEGPDEWLLDPYDYRIVRTAIGIGYVWQGTVVSIPNAPLDRPLYDPAEMLDITPEEVVSCMGPMSVSYGRLLLNYAVLIFPFGKKLGFWNRKFMPADVEREILKIGLLDNPPTGSGRGDNRIYVDEYLKYVEAAFGYGGFTKLFVPSLTRKSVTAPPNNAALRKELLKKYEGQLHDPAIIALIDRALIENDSKYLEGDESEGFLITGKSRKTVRRRLYLMAGAERALDGSVDVELIDRSFSEGWDVSKFPIMNNSLRLGSYSRGQETVLGGVAVKWLYRAASNLAITSKDCGTRLGRLIHINTPEDVTRYKEFWYLNPDGTSSQFDSATPDVYVGKSFIRRSPQYCRNEKTDFCEQCMGPRLSANPTAVSAAVVSYGNAFLGIFMSAAHAKDLALAKMSYRTAII